ncbi:MAG TPA: GNAT family protein [Xanthomonadales bacterium]|nr:GNAT family protein [Xanthomonadales bacterium]
MPVDRFGQPIGEAVPGFTPPARPPRTPMRGTCVDVEPLDLDRHVPSLFRAQAEDRDGRRWTYLAYEQPATESAYREFLASISGGDDPLFHAIVDRASGDAVGLATYLRIEPKQGSIEVGHLNFSPRLSRTRGATEAIFLLMRRAFDELGYRRFEWKCDALNAPSRRAAERFGFTFEGVFRQATVYKGRNRDTAWYSILDREWPALRAAYERWLDPANFASDGTQRVSLGSLVGATPVAIPLQ